MNLSKLRTNTPEFNFIEFFTGHLKASGWVTDRFGNVRRHFHGDFIGTLKDDTLELDETLYYSDGVEEHRVWHVNISENGAFTAESPALINGAKGLQKGNTLEMYYTMRVDLANGKQWTLDMDDYMFLQPDGSLHNFANVKRWGIRIASVSTQYQRVVDSSLNESFGGKEVQSIRQNPQHLQAVGKALGK